MAHASNSWLSFPYSPMEMMRFQMPSTRPMPYVGGGYSSDGHYSSPYCFLEPSNGNGKQHFRHSFPILGNLAGSFSCSCSARIVGRWRLKRLNCPFRKYNYWNTLYQMAAFFAICAWSQPFALYYTMMQEPSFCLQNPGSVLIIMSWFDRMWAHPHTGLTVEQKAAGWLASSMYVGGPHLSP